MRRSSLKISVAPAAVLLLLDAAVLGYVGDASNGSIGWWHIVGVVAIQIGIIGVVTAWRSMRWGSVSLEADRPVSYRSQWPVTMVGAILVALALSLCLLYVGLACPTQGIPSVRGTSICS